MNSSSSSSPFRKRVDSVSKSSNSRSRIGITCPGTFSSTSGFSSDPVRALCIGLPSGRGRTTKSSKRQSGFGHFGGWGCYPSSWVSLRSTSVAGPRDATRPSPRRSPANRARLPRPATLASDPVRTATPPGSGVARAGAGAEATRRDRPSRMGNRSDRRRDGGGSRRGSRRALSRRLRVGRHPLWGLSDAGDHRRSGERELEPVDDDDAPKRRL